MLDFDLNEDHLAVERMVREFAANEVAPHIQENDYSELSQSPTLTRQGTQVVSDRRKH